MLASLCVTLAVCVSVGVSVSTKDTDCVAVGRGDSVLVDDMEEVRVWL